MRDRIDTLLGEDSLVMIAFAIAFGWSLFQVAHGVATFIDGLGTHYPAGESGFVVGGLTWIVDRRLITLDSLLEGVIELAVVVAAWMVVSRRRDQI